MRSTAVLTLLLAAILAAAAHAAGQSPGFVNPVRVNGMAVYYPGDKAIVYGLPGCMVEPLGVNVTGYTLVQLEAPGVYTLVCNGTVVDTAIASYKVDAGGFTATLDPFNGGTVRLKYARYAGGAYAEIAGRIAVVYLAGGNNVYLYVNPADITLNDSLEVPAEVTLLINYTVEAGGLAAEIHPVLVYKGVARLEPSARLGGRLPHVEIDAGFIPRTCRLTSVTVNGVPLARYTVRVNGSLVKVRDEAVVSAGEAHAKLVFRCSRGNLTVEGVGRLEPGIYLYTPSPSATGWVPADSLAPGQPARILVYGSPANVTGARLWRIVPRGNLTEYYIVAPLSGFVSVAASGDIVVYRVEEGVNTAAYLDPSWVRLGNGTLVLTGRPVRVSYGASADCKILPARVKTRLLAWGVPASKSYISVEFGRLAEVRLTRGYVNETVTLTVPPAARGSYTVALYYGRSIPAHSLLIVEPRALIGQYDGLLVAAATGLDPGTHNATVTIRYGGVILSYNYSFDGFEWCTRIPLEDVAARLAQMLPEGSYTVDADAAIRVGNATGEARVAFKLVVARLPVYRFRLGAEPVGAYINGSSTYIAVPARDAAILLYTAAGAEVASPSYGNATIVTCSGGVCLYRVDSPAALVLACWGWRRSGTQPRVRVATLGGGYLATVYEEYEPGECSRLTPPAPASHQPRTVTKTVTVVETRPVTVTVTRAMTYTIPVSSTVTRTVTVYQRIYATRTVTRTYTTVATVPKTVTYTTTTVRLIPVTKTVTAAPRTPLEATPVTAAILAGAAAAGFIAGRAARRG